MIDDIDLPPDRPLPQHLQDALWGRVMPKLEVPRRGKPGAPLLAAAAVGVLAVGAAVVFGPARAGESAGSGSPGRSAQPVAPAPDPGDVKLVKDCVNATLAYGIPVPDRDSWRPAAKIGAGTPHGFLVIRNAKAAAVCVVDDGKATA